MAGPDIQQQKTLPPINALAENNFDKLQKTYPNQKDALTFLDDKKFSDIKESLSKTIYDLSKENIVSQEDFWNNIQKVIEMIFSDESISADIMERDIQANNIFLFRTEFNNLSKQGISLNKQDTNVNKQDIE
jgi:CHAD domain-containing protein